MSAPDHEKVTGLFLQAADLDPAERQAFLDRACAGDAELRARVESLLRYDARLPPMLDTGSMLARATEALDRAPAAIGAYRIVEQIGEGGMGVVYLAEQHEPIRRQVALKLIKRGLETEQVLKRFDSERQVLALLDHPGIARVLDSGATDEGRPYFAMEHVKGEPITQFCDAGRLDVDARLRLFLQVCEAVEHAHQNAIIHRDLKPSNILVTRVSERPVPKVIDFGIARAVTRGPGDTALTEVGQIVGTLEYMSPEQATLVPQGVDTRADVYALGAILYELLAGSPPYEPSLLRALGTDEARRRIREEDPPRPSTRIARLAGDAGRVAADRRGTPRSIERRLRGDLDCIVMKAVERERSRRYGSVAALAADLRRHLSDQPIEARPPGGAYRLAKLVRRHRTATAVVAALVPLLVGFSATMAVQARRIARERDRAEEIAEFLVRFYDLPFYIVDRHAQPRAEDVLLRSAAKIEELDDRPELQARLAHQMGRVLGAVGRVDAAEALLQDAQARLVALEGPQHPRALAAAHDLALVRWLRRDPGAESSLLATLEARRRILGDRHPETLRAMIDVGHAYKFAQRYAEALPWLERAVDGLRALYGDGHEETKNAVALCASVYLDLRRFDETAAMLEPLIPTFHGESPEVYIALYNLACARAGQGRRDEALATLRRAVDRGFWSGMRADGFWERYLDDPEFIELAKRSELRYDLVRKKVDSVAGAYMQAGSFAEAAALYEAVLAEVPLTPEARSAWQMRLASAYLGLERYAEAEPLVLSRAARLRGSPTAMGELAKTLGYLVQARLGQHDMAGAVQALDEQDAAYGEADVPYNRAVRAALAGERAVAFAELRHAMRRGFADLDRLQRDLAFRPLRGTAEFEALVAEIRRRSWAPSDLSLDVWVRLSVMPALAEGALVDG